MFIKARQCLDYHLLQKYVVSSTLAWLILKGYVRKGMPQRSIEFKKMSIGRCKSVRTTLSMCIHGQNYITAIFEFIVGNEVSSSGNEVSSSGNEVSSSGNEVSSSGNRVSSSGNEECMNDDFMDAIDYFFDCSQSSEPIVELLNGPVMERVLDVEMQDRDVHKESWVIKSSTKNVRRLHRSPCLLRRKPSHKQALPRYQCREETCLTF